MPAKAQHRLKCVYQRRDNTRDTGEQRIDHITDKTKALILSITKRIAEAPEPKISTAACAGTMVKHK